MVIVDGLAAICHKDTLGEDICKLHADIVQSAHIISGSIDEG